MLLMLSASAQDVSSVLGIPFGSTKPEVIAAMKKKGYKEYYEIRNVVEYEEKIAFGKFTLFTAEFNFTKDARLNDVALYVKNDDEQNLLKEFDLVVAELGKKYGKGESRRKYNNNYKNNSDKVILQEIKAGTTTIKHIWNFSGAAVEVVLMSTPNIAIHYQNDNITYESERIENEKFLKDYGKDLESSTTFFALPIGASKSAVFSAMKNRGYTNDPYYKKRLHYNAPVTFGKFSPQQLTYKFDDNDKLINILMVIKPKKRDESIDTFDIVVNTLMSQYGPGEAKTPAWTESQKSTISKIIYIESGKSKYQYWHKWETEKTVLKVELTKEMLIEISYTNSPLMEAFEKKEIIRRSEDY